MDLSNITNKFYSTEEERLAKLERNKNHVNMLSVALNNDIKFLLEQKIQFYVVDINPKAKKLHAIMIPCCGSQRKVPDQFRKRIEEVAWKVGFVIEWEL